MRNDAFMYVAAGDGIADFNNSGTFRKSVGTGLTRIGGGQGWTLNNSGTVDITTGLLDLGSGLTAHTQSGGAILLNGGDLSIYRLLEFYRWDNLGQRRNYRRSD